MYSDYLSIFDTSVYKYIGENKEYLRRCRQVSKDTIFLIEHKKLTQWIDFVIIKSTSHNNIKNGKYKESYSITNIHLMTEKKRNLLIAINKYTDTAINKDHDTIIKEIIELEKQIYNTEVK